MAAPTREAESWPSQRLPLVLSHQCWEYYLTGRTPWRQNTASPGKPAAGYHLSAAYCRCHQCRVGWAVCLDISPHSKGIQCSRYNIWKSCPHNLWDSRCVARPNVQTHCKKYYHLYIEEIHWTLFKLWRRVRNSVCPNNLVNALRLVLCDPCPALSVTLEGLQSWVIKGATQASGWERVYGYLEPHLKLLGGGRGNLFSCPSRLPSVYS